MYSAMRKRAGLSCKELAAKLKGEFPRISSAAICLAEKPHETGVMYTGAARLAVTEACGAPEARRPVVRRDTSRVSCWVSESVRDVFNASKSHRGFVTDKAYLEYLILEDAKAIKSAAAPGGTGTTAKG